MTWTSFGNGLYAYNSNTDSQITTGITEGSGLIDFYTNNKYLFTAGAWVLIAGGGGGGEVNTYSNAGVGGIAVILTKSGVNLPFKSVKANSTKIAVSDGGANNNVLIDVNDANLSVAWSQLTSVPSSFTPSTHASSHNSAGGDVVHIDTIGAGTDITTNNASTAKHGLLKKLSNAATDYMDGTGNWSVPPSGGGGETNTYSTVGTGAAWTLTKSGVNLPFRSFIMGSSKLSLTTNANDLTIDVAQANLSIAYSQLTSVPSTFAPTAHKSAHVSGGGDAFVKTDVLVAASRYIETRTDPASDAQAIWINATSTDIEYWDTQASPVKQTIATIGTTQTFTNKTLTTPVISTISNTGTITLPTATTTLVGHATSDTLTNKTMVAASNTFTDTSAVTGDILRHDGTRFVRKAKGTGLQVLRTNSGATDIEWASLISENAGTALASGNGSTTVFNVAHSLGSNPSIAMIICSTVTNTFTYTTDSTNIVITFATAPASGTNNVKFHFRVIA